MDCKPVATTIKPLHHFHPWKPQSTLEHILHPVEQVSSLTGIRGDSDVNNDCEKHESLRAMIVELRVRNVNKISQNANPIPAIRSLTSRVSLQSTQLVNLSCQ